MSVNKNGNLRPDGISFTIPMPPRGRIGGTYYWNPGSATAPHLTFTSTQGLPGAGLHAVFLKPGMTSSDTLGTGASGTLSTIFPSMTVNGTAPDEGDLISRLRNARQSSFEVGIHTPDASPALTHTYTPQQIADRIFRPAGDSGDELSPFIRSLQSGQGEVGPPSEPPIRFLGRRDGNALGNGMTGWTGNLPDENTDPAAVNPNGCSGNAGAANVSSSSFMTGAPSVPFLPPASQSTPGGLPGLIASVAGIDPSDPDRSPAGGLLALLREYMRNNPDGDSAR